MTNVIIPQKISFFQWASQQNFADPSLNWPVAPASEKDWRTWATLVVYYDNRFPSPSEQVYPKDEGWRDWASFVIYILLSN